MNLPKKLFTAKRIEALKKDFLQFSDGFTPNFAAAEVLMYVQHNCPRWCTTDQLEEFFEAWSEEEDKKKKPAKASARARVRPRELKVSRAQAEKILQRLYEAARDAWREEDSQFLGMEVMDVFDEVFKQKVQPGIKKYWAEEKETPKVTIKVKP